MSQTQSYTLDDLKPGMTESYAKTVTEADIVQFADVTGDTNPVHLDADYAAGTIFKERIAHGMLSAGFISTVFGTKMPGPGCIYLNQSLNFKAAVKIGDKVTATVTVKEVQAEKKRVVFETVCTVDGNVVLDGEATLMPPRRPVVRDAAE
ncbi:MaoC family dehydratase [Rhodovibrionaceae bacterium A322]